MKEYNIKKDFNTYKQVSHKTLTITQFVLVGLIFVNFFTHKEIYSLLMIGLTILTSETIFSYSMTKHKEDLVGAIAGLIAFIGVTVLYVISIIE